MQSQEAVETMKYIIIILMVALVYIFNLPKSTVIG